VLKAVIATADLENVGELRDALRDAGCISIATVCPEVAVTAVASGADLPDLVVLCLAGGGLAPLQQLTRAHRDLPILVICEANRIDAVLLAGAAECVVTPVRPNELRGRLRQLVRVRESAVQRAERERKLAAQVVALQAEKEALERLACVDPLTGVANRRYTLSLLKSEWRRSSREHLPLGLVMIDLDCFHAYNEIYGHLGGDACLRRVNEAMATCLRRPSDFLGRYGGEEFVAVLPNTDAAGARLVAERLRRAVEALQLPHTKSTCASVVTITAGFASIEAPVDMTVDQLIGAADAALLRAKTLGRNLVEGDSPAVEGTTTSASAWLRFDPVHADPWLVDRIPQFLAEAQRDSQEMMRALDVGDTAAIAVMAAALRTAAHGLGLSLVEHIVDDLEHAALERNSIAAQRAAEELAQYVTHVQIIYRRVGETARQMRAVTSS
jgi:diguanylate cyclase (GGDEF)-like protein